MDNLFEKIEYEKIMENLAQSEDDFVKIFSVINLDQIKTKKDANLLLNHLTNHPTPIREAVALKLEDLDMEYFLDEYAISQFLLALSDINPNISRSICSIISKTPQIQDLIEDKIIDKIQKILPKISENPKKSHAQNKDLFALYWLLEGLSCTKLNKNNSKVLEILNSTINFKDYTIREKTAKILAKIDNPPPKLLQIVQQDVNFYVKFHIQKDSL